MRWEFPAENVLRPINHFMGVYRTAIGWKPIGLLLTSSVFIVTALGENTVFSSCHYAVKPKMPFQDKFFLNECLFPQIIM